MVTALPLIVGHWQLLAFCSNCCFIAVIRSEVPTDVSGIVMLIHFLIALYVCGRVDERSQRLQFLWTQEVKTQLQYRCVHHIEHKSVFQVVACLSLWYLNLSPGIRSVAFAEKYWCTRGSLPLAVCIHCVPKKVMPKFK